MTYPLFHPQHPGEGTAPSVLTPEEFAQAFNAESAYVEFKKGFSGAIPAAVAAFSNTDGGVILIGVTDRGEVEGVGGNGARREDQLHRCAGDLHNPGRYHVRRLDVGGRLVLVMVVEKRLEGFCQTSNGRVLVRRGASNRALIGAGLSEFIAARSLRRFETTPTEADLDSADPELRQDLADRWSWGEDQLAERLRERRFSEKTGQGAKMTVAGALYLLREPHRILGKAYVEVLRFRGEDTDYDRRFEITGPLQVQVRDTTAFVLEQIGFDLVVLDLYRNELWRLPEDALREAIANAVAHRSYEMSGTPVRVDIHQDRVVVTSPGGLPEPVTVENIREQNAARNLEVIRTLRRYGLAEDIGRGVDKMYDEMASYLLAPPEFEEAGSSVRVTLRMGGVVIPEERAWVAELQRRGSLAPRDGLLLVHAARGEILTNSKARQFLGVDSVQARLALQRLRDQGLLIQQGERGGAEYLISSDLSPPSRVRPLSDEKIGSMVVDLARAGSVTNQIVRERTGLDRVKALRLLARLVAGGRLERCGQGRGTYYVLPGSR